MAKWRRPSRLAYGPERTSRLATLNAAKARAGDLLERDQVEEALAILEPLAGDFQQDAELKMMLGTCYYGVGDPDAALLHFESAYALDKQPEMLLPLGIVYVDLEMYGSALHVFSELKRRGGDLPDEMRVVLQGLRQDVTAMAREMDLPLEKAVAGLREMERGTRWLDRGEYGRAIEANRAAIRLLGNWPPPHNNLTLALFFDGQVPAAIATCRQVLARRPDNITAACNLVRCLAWSGEREAAQEVWQPLRTHVPTDLPTEALKVAEAAAVMDDDESVRRLLLPLGAWTPERIGYWGHYLQVQQFLATADANLGNGKAAKRRLRDVDDDDPRLEKLRTALRQGKSGLGLTPRFSYYFSFEVVPRKVSQEFAELVVATEDGTNARAVKALARFSARYPQLVVMAEKSIWEEDAIDFGMLMLRYVGTPAAHAALRRFACSQAGSDEQRLSAFLYLQASGGVQSGETLRMWRDGDWHEVQARGFTIGPAGDRPQHKAKAVKLMEQGQAALRAGQGAEAVTLFRQVTDLEPHAYDALNDLAAALDMAGDKEASRAALERALTINPTYVFARVNLAVKLIGEDVDAAAALLEPLEAHNTFTPEEFAFYQYGLAQVAIARKEYDAARSMLNLALSIAPDYEPVTNLLAHLEEIEYHLGIGEIWERAHERFLASNAEYRRRQQAKLATLAPSVVDTVGVYSAEVLRSIAKAVAPQRRLTGLRKADLKQLVTEALLEPETIEFIVGQRLSDTERAALAAVLAAGGVMPQDQFRAAYGDDAADSPWWQYHLPESVAGRLRLHCLLAETTVEGTVYLAVPVELRVSLAAVLQE